MAEVCDRTRRRVGSRLVAVGLVGAALLDACGDSPSKALGKRPEDVKAPLAEVRAKLPRIVSLGNDAHDAASRGDWEEAREAFGNLHAVWFKVEGTVRELSRDLYEQIETAQGLISDGTEVRNLDRVATGASDQADAIQEFLDTYQ